MKEKNFRYIYGPVPSWRLGSSLGIDLLSQRKKICSFDCIYCQVGRSKGKKTTRRVYVPTDKVVAEIKALPKVEFDYITFSGHGEPTLAKNLGQTIKAIKKLRKEPVAVLTNASLLSRKDAREELLAADLVAVKLDTASEKGLQLVNRPAKSIKFATIFRGIKQFRKQFRGKLALQIMLMKENEAFAKNIAKLAKIIRPDEIQICTPIRPSPIRPLERKALTEIKKNFAAIKVASVYDVKRKRVRPISSRATMLRRGKSLE